MRKLLALGALPVLLLKACPAPMPATPNDGMKACLAWTAQHHVLLNGPGGCLAYADAIGIADKAVDGRPYCVRLWYKTGFVEQVCTRDATHRTFTRPGQVLVRGEVV